MGGLVIAPGFIDLHSMPIAVWTARSSGDAGDHHGFYAKPEELAELAKAAAEHGGFYSSHVRDEENDVLNAWRETIEVGRQARLPVHISHMKLASKADRDPPAVWRELRTRLRRRSIKEDRWLAGLSPMHRIAFDDECHEIEIRRGDIFVKGEDLSIRMP